MSVTTLVTAEQLMRMPKDGCRYELVAGELRKLPPSGLGHGVALLTLGGFLSNYVEHSNLGMAAGPAGFLLARDPDTVLAPDLAFIRRERVPANPLTHGLVSGAPDLAVEVTSPNDTRREVKEKAEAWVEAGARMVWVVDPVRRTVTVYRPATAAKTLTEDDDLDGQDVLPGFCCRVADIFRVE